MVNTIYQKSFAALMKRPFRLWGISLLGALLCWLAGIGFAGILAVGFAIAWAIDVSLAMIFLHTYQTGEEPHTADLFQTFRKDRFLRVVGGMAWMSLWIFLWSLIPVVGIVFGVIRMYEYRFVPYILMTRDDVKPTDALRVSREQTMGYKGKMFWADVIPVLLWIAVVLVLSLLGIIPYLGVLFRVILFLFNIVYGLFLNLFYGIQHAAFYAELQDAAGPSPAAPVVPPVIPAPQAPKAEEPVKESEAPKAEAPAEEAKPAEEANEAPASAEAAAEPEAPHTCPVCGMPVQLDEKFCTSCGHKL